jgi:6-phosphofructokinase 1
MGRHAGFLTAAAALARGEGKTTADRGPHLIYLPEVPFDTKRFLADVQGVMERLGRCQVAVSEGVQDAQGRPIATTLVDTLDKDAHGNVQLSGVGALGDALAELVKKTITIDGKAPRVRADTFGYLQRCWPDPSPVDAKEARAAAKFAVKLAQRGERSGSVAIVRKPGRKYAVEFRHIPLTEVAGKTRHMPAEYMSGHADISRKFIEYARPLVGTLPVMERI